MGEPRIVHKEFLLVCLKYEFLKNNTCHAQAHRNLCEMMLAEDVREDVTREIDVSTPGSSVNSNYNSDSGNASQCSEEMPMAPPTNEPGPSNPKKRRISQMCSVESQGSTHSDTRNTIDPVDSDGEDEDPESNLNFLMEDEGDPKINIIAFEVMRAIFDEFRRDLVEPDVEALRMPIELSRLRREVYLHLKLYRPITFPMMDRNSGVFIPITAIESSLGSGSAKINLSHPSSFHKSQMQYLEDSKGTWIFYEDDVRFLKNLHYTDLAANALIESLDQISMPLERLSFDVEDKTKWSQYPNINFYKKIKKWTRTPRFEFRIRRFYMKILKNHPKRNHPFKLRYMNKEELEDLTIHVWEDGTPGAADLTSLEDMKENEVFKKVKHLNIEDPNMDQWEIDVKKFRTVHRWRVTPEQAKILKEEYKKKKSPPYELTLYSKQRFSLTDMRTALKTKADGIFRGPTDDGLRILEIMAKKHHKICFKVG